MFGVLAGLLGALCAFLDRRELPFVWNAIAALVSGCVALGSLFGVPN
jgi:hypothetical protein